MIRALIIDDENKACELLKKLINKHCKEVLIEGMADSVESGLSLINQYKPDLVFLDVEMNDGSGFDLLEKFPNKDFHVIFTTAYSYYGLKAMRYAAADYLLKPIDPEELKTAVEKVRYSIKKT